MIAFLFKLLSVAALSAPLPSRVEGNTTVYKVGPDHELRITGTVATFGSTVVIDHEGRKVPEVIQMHSEDVALQKALASPRTTLVFGGHGPSVGVGSPMGLPEILEVVQDHFKRADPKNPKPFQQAFLSVCHGARMSGRAAGQELSRFFGVPAYASVGHFQFSPAADATKHSSVQIHESGTSLKADRQLVKYFPAEMPELLERPMDVIPNVPWRVPRPDGGYGDSWLYWDSGSQSLLDEPPPKKALISEPMHVGPETAVACPDSYAGVARPSL
jgi:hypothetical protein